MGFFDVNDSAYLKGLARKAHNGETLSRNEEYALKEAIRVGVKDVKNIRDGKLP